MWRPGSFHLRWRRATAVLSAALSITCRPQSPSGHPTVDNREQPILGNVGVEVLQSVDLPTIQVLRRKGDPEDALGIAIFTSGGSQGSVALSALFQARLRTLNVDFSIEVTGLATLAVISFPRDGAVNEILTEIHEALHRPVGDEELAALDLPARLARLKQLSDSAPSEVGQCEGRLGAEGAGALLPAPTKWAAWLEEIRTQSVVASRVGLSAIGSGRLLTDVRGLHRLPWRSGPPVDDSWAPGMRTAVMASTGAREIQVALRVADGERALAAGRALRQSDHPLRQRLRGYSARFSLSDVRVTLRPAGACLVVALEVEGDAPKVDQIAATALLVDEEMEAATRQSLSPEERGLTLVEPQTATETAALAAWSAVRSPVAGAAPAQLIEYRDRGPGTPSSAGLRQRLLAIHREWQGHELPILQRDELGQGQLYVMLASGCGTGVESAEESGLRALTIASLAEQFSGERGVVLIPFVSPDGVGLVARAARLRGETPTEHGERVGRVLAGALSGSAIDGRLVAQARARQLARVGSDPGLALVHSVFGGEHVSALEPYGNDNTLSSFSTADVERTREDLVLEPLRLAVLTNSGPEQGSAVQSAVERWLASQREHISPCREAKLSPAPPGQWTVETLEEHIQPGAFIGAFAPVRPEVGRAFEYHLSQHPELFQSPGVSDTWPSDWQIRWDGNTAGGVLWIHLTAPPDRVAAQVEKVRLGLHRLAQSGLSAGSVQTLRAEFARREKAVDEQPIGRLIRTWRDQAPLPPSEKELAVLTSSLTADQHRIVVVKQRK